MDVAVPAGNTDANDWVSDISLADVVVELEIEDEHDFFLDVGVGALLQYFFVW